MAVASWGARSEDGRVKHRRHAYYNLMKTINMSRVTADIFAHLGKWLSVICNSSVVLRWTKRELLVRLFTSTGREGIKLSNKLGVVAISELSPLTRVDWTIMAAARGLRTGLLATGVLPLGRIGSSRALTGRRSKAAYRTAVPESWTENIHSVFPLWLQEGYMFGGGVCPCHHDQSASW